MTRGCWCVCFPRDPRNKGNLETTGSSSIRDAGYPDSGLAALVPARHINHRNGLAACKRNTGGKQVARNDPPLSRSCAQEPGEKGVRRSPSGQVAHFWQSLRHTSIRDGCPNSRPQEEIWVAALVCCKCHDTPTSDKADSVEEEQDLRDKHSFR